MNWTDLQNIFRTNPLNMQDNDGVDFTMLAVTESYIHVTFFLKGKCDGIYQGMYNHAPDQVDFYVETNLPRTKIPVWTTEMQAFQSRIPDPRDTARIQAERLRIQNLDVRKIYNLLEVRPLIGTVLNTAENSGHWIHREYGIYKHFWTHNFNEFGEDTEMQRTLIRLQLSNMKSDAEKDMLILRGLLA